MSEAETSEPMGPVSEAETSEPMGPVSEAERSEAPRVVSVRPEPTPEVLAAIVAAVEQAWPRPSAPERSRREGSVWRFSGRWWAKPAPLRRDRPWAASLHREMPQ